MEAQTPFDLTAALAAWRAELAAQPGLTPEQIRELESHLVDSLVDLTRQGQSDQEAFRIARQQLGPAERIAEEFVKVNPAGLWRERAFWMVAGVAGVFLFNVVFIGLCLSSLPMRLHLAGFDVHNRWWNWTIFRVMPVGLAWLALKLADGNLPKSGRRFLELAGTPRRLGWALVILLAGHAAYTSVIAWQFDGRQAAPRSVSPWRSPVALAAATGLILLLLAPRGSTATKAWGSRILWMAIGVLANRVWLDGSCATVDGLAYWLTLHGAVIEPWFFYSWFPLASCGWAGIALLVAFHGLPNSLRRLGESLNEPRRLAAVLFGVLLCVVVAVSWSDVYRFQVMFPGRLRPGFSPPMGLDVWSYALNSALLNALEPTLAAFVIVRLLSRQRVGRPPHEASA